MKKIFILSIVLLFVSNLFAQISEGGTPYSSKYNLRSEIPIVEAPYFNAELQRDMDDQENKLGIKPFRFAKSFEMNADLTNSGIWETLPNGDQLWRLKLKSENAFSLNVIFSEYYLPKNAKVFIYNQDKSFIIGAFTNKNNKKSKILPTQLIPGDEIIIEYYEPKEVEFHGVLKVGTLSHDYRGIINKDGQFGTSGSCNIDINCAEGAEWQKEKHAVCRMVIRGAELCTGGLIANVKKDDVPYFLTAEHCINDENDATQTVFYFNYESPTCNGEDGSVSQTISGSDLKATTPNLDFALVELSRNPPENYEPYFLGWDASGDPVTGAVAIHHPNGDVKKIAIDEDKLTISTYPEDYDANTHWLVGRWDYGVTEGGSSGGPLFDMNGRIIGDLTGGLATCSNPIKDYYQRFSNSWDDYSSADKQLKHWLDPDNSGTIKMDGYDPYQVIGEPIECISVANVLESQNPSMYFATNENDEIVGYIAGNNDYGDLAKAEYFADDLYGTRSVIDGAFFWFGAAKGGNTPISINVYNEVDGAPGQQIGSGVTNISTIITDVDNEEYTYVDFDPFIEIPGPFYIGVMLPQSSGDTLALVTNDEDDSDVNTGWEMFGDGTWHAYNDDSSWGLTLSHYLFAVVCNVSTAVPELNLMEAELLQIYPNPSDGRFIIDASLLQDEDYVLEVYSTLGNNMLSIHKSKNDFMTEIDLSNYQNGLYLIHMVREDGQRIIKKIIVQ
jgi:lysyl endopeptidase